MKCNNCGSERWKRGTTPEALTIDGRTFKADLTADLCETCGESLVSIDEMGRFEVAIAAELARAGARSGEAIKFMRKAIGLRAVDLADLLDVAPETLSRWETGERAAPRAHVVTLGALVLDHAAGSTSTVDRLRALRGERSAEPSEVRLALGGGLLPQPGGA